MTAPTSSPRMCFRCGSTQILETKAAGGGQFVCVQKRGPCGFWWERSDGVQIFQRTRMLPDGPEHPLLSPEGIWRVGRVLEVVTPEERPRT